MDNPESRNLYKNCLNAKSIFVTNFNLNYIIYSEIIINKKYYTGVIYSELKKLIFSLLLQFYPLFAIIFIIK